MRAWLYAAVMFGIAAAVYAATLRPGQDWGGDFAQYVQHARNLATGRPYLETKFEHMLFNKKFMKFFLFFLKNHSFLFS